MVCKEEMKTGIFLIRNSKEKRMSLPDKDEVKQLPVISGDKEVFFEREFFMDQDDDTVKRAHVQFKGSFVFHMCYPDEDQRCTGGEKK